MGLNFYSISAFQIKFKNSICHLYFTLPGSPRNICSWVVLICKNFSRHLYSWNTAKVGVKHQSINQYKTN